MGNEIKWEKTDLEEFGIHTIAYIENDKRFPCIEVVGYNGFLKGEEVVYDGKKYIVSSVFMDGDFGLSETGELPYQLKVHAVNVKKH